MRYKFEMTLGQALTRSAYKYPDKIAIQDDRVRLTYIKFNSRVNRLAHALEGLGLLKGDHIVTLSSNCVELMEVYMAALKLGAILCPLDMRGTQSDQTHELQLVHPKALIFHAEQAERASLLLQGLQEDIVAVSMGEDNANQYPNTTNLISQGAASEPALKISEEDIAFILFTGGTTGTPKGVILTHRNLIWNAINVISENGSPSPESRIYYPMQIYHSGALSRFLATIYAGGTFIATKTFDPAYYLNMVEQEHCTFVVGNTAIWNMLLEESKRRQRNTSSVTSWLHAQGEITPEFKNEIAAVLFPNGKMYGSYALTEASPGVTVLKPHDHPRKWPGIGRPYISLEVRLTDEHDEDVPVGEVGQILVRGPNVMKGYYQNPEETALTLAGGWLHTGDLGRMDDLGYFYFVDRLKDVIKSGGINVYAREVEDVILTHPQVREVAVIGVPHPKWGETIRALIVPVSGGILSSEEIISYCKSRLASHKKPTSVIFVDELPKGSFGSKVLKKILREVYCNP